MGLEELNIYNIALSLGGKVFIVVEKWDYLSKKTVGIQLIRSADSIAANIAEGYGRYHYKDVNNFNFYARGSLFETKAWLSKALQRKLIDERSYKELELVIRDLSVKLNNYIKVIKNHKR